MQLLSKLNSLDNVADGSTRKLLTTATSSGSGNAVTAVSISGDTLTYTKGSTFSLSNHTHDAATSSAAGFLSAAEGVSNTFIEKGKVIYSLKSRDKEKVVKDTTGTYKNYKIVVLIDENTASAAEILAAALKDSYGATIVGKKSFGKGKVQQTVRLKNGSMAKYTSAKWYRPNGECIDGVGIIPDYEVDLTIEKDKNGNITNIIDSQLDKAIELLS